MKPIYIFDLDGTLADTEHRLHFIQREKKDWRGFFAAAKHDRGILKTVATAQRLRAAGCRLWVWTGRSDEVAADTRIWLELWGIDHAELRMRKAGDHRPDHIIKAEWLESVPHEERVWITAVFEDRDRVVQMWREAGLTCYQVAPGAF